MRKPTPYRKSEDFRLVKLSGVDAKLRLGRRPRALETKLFTLVTAGMGHFAWSMRRRLRAANVCRSQRIAQCHRTGVFTLELRARAGLHCAWRRAIARRRSRVG